MSYDERQDVSQFALSSPAHIDDGNGPLTLAAGLVAGLVAGGLWAAIVRITNYEIGYAAWGVGLLVGWAMTRVTHRRSTSLAAAAAAFAIIGLVAGKAFIFIGSAGAIADEFSGNDDLLASVVAWDLYESRGLDAATLEELDAAQAAGDTLSDAVWESMRSQAAAHVAGMSADERHATARRAANATMSGIGLTGGIRSQLSFFDLLWIFLAVGTAFRMLAPAKEPEPIEPQPA